MTAATTIQEFRLRMGECLLDDQPSRAPRRVETADRRQHHHHRQTQRRRARREGEFERALDEDLTRPDRERPSPARRSAARDTSSPRRSGRPRARRGARSRAAWRRWRRATPISRVRSTTLSVSVDVSPSPPTSTTSPAASSRALSMMTRWSSNALRRSAERLDVRATPMPGATSARSSSARRATGRPRRRPRVTTRMLRDVSAQLAGRVPDIPGRRVRGRCRIELLHDADDRPGAPSLDAQPDVAADAQAGRS